jgi:hypothetical protein
MNIGIERRYDVGDIAVDKQFSRGEADDLVRRYPAVRAADPEIFRLLYLTQPFKILRICALDFGGPLTIVGCERN